MQDEISGRLQARWSETVFMHRSLSGLDVLPKRQGSRRKLCFQHVKLASISVNEGRKSGGGLVRDIHPKPHGSCSLLDCRALVLGLTMCI